jgi:hypothetical protein
MIYGRALPCSISWDIETPQVVLYSMPDPSQQAPQPWISHGADLFVQDNHRGELLPQSVRLVVAPDIRGGANATMM